MFFFAAIGRLPFTGRRARRVQHQPSTKLGQQLPALSATLPFLLLIMVTLRLPLANPSPVFGLAVLLVILLLAMSEILSLDLLPAVALVSVLALEHVWHFQHFDPSSCPAPPDLVSRVLCAVHNISVPVPRQVCRQKHAVGGSSPRGSVAFLSHI